MARRIAKSLSGLSRWKILDNLPPQPWFHRLAAFIARQLDAHS